MRYYKVHMGYNLENFMPIDETELEKAIKAHITGAVAIFEAGSVSGKTISMIKEDIHKTLGLNYGYRLEPEDYQLFARDHRDTTEFLAETKERLLIESKLSNNLQLA